MVLGRVVSCPALSMWNRKRENTGETRDGLKLLDARARELFTRVTRVYEEGGIQNLVWLSVSCNWRRNIVPRSNSIPFKLFKFRGGRWDGRVLTSIINSFFYFLSFCRFLEFFWTVSLRVSSWFRVKNFISLVSIIFIRWIINLYKKNIWIFSLKHSSLRRKIYNIFFMIK